MKAYPLLVVCLFASNPAIAQSQPVNTAKITIDAGQVTGSINPLLYGQFLEYMFEGIKGGLHAELIRDRGFEEAANGIGLPRDWDRYPDNRNDDYGINFLWDKSTSYPGRTDSGHALRVDVSDGVIPRRGLYQSRMPVRAGVEYSGYVWFKSTDYKGSILVALEPDIAGSQPYVEARIDSVAGDWKRYDFHLTSPRNDPLARFAILFTGQGRLWLDQISMIPGDSVGGVRRDVLDRVEAVRPGFLRWPGGNVAQDYHWLWGIGPKDERPIWTNLAWKNETENGDFGTPEYLAFCKRVGAVPTITVNVEGRGATAEAAAAWVEYCNGPSTSKHGAMRVADGHPEPYAVKYWEIGNEIWGDWVRGHSDAATYARNFNRYATAMKAVDPSIKLIAVGDKKDDWNREVLTTAGQGIDFLSVHHYYSRRDMRGDRLNLMAHPLRFERIYTKIGTMIRDLVPGRSIPLAINEWGLDLIVDQQYSIDAGLYAARLMNGFERSKGVVGMSAVSDLVNGWPGGIIQASRHGVFVTPIYLVNRLYAEHLGSDLLASTVSGPTFNTSKEGESISVIDVVASRSRDGKQIYIKAVNTHSKQRLNATIQISGTLVAKQGQRSTVRSLMPGGTNGFATPNAVDIFQSGLSTDPDFAVDLPPASVSVFTLDVHQ